MTTQALLFLMNYQTRLRRQLIDFLVQYRQTLKTNTPACDRAWCFFKILVFL